MDHKEDTSRDLELQPRVLIVEDCEDTIQFLSYLLKTTGVDVVMAGDGLSCIDLVEEAAISDNPFDLVFIDLNIPNLDGRSTVRHLRKLGHTQAIVAITATSSLHHQRSSVHSGCDHFLAKNNIAETLLPTVEKLLRKSTRTLL